MAGALGLHVITTQLPVAFISATKQTFRRASVIRCAANPPNKRYTIAVLPGDGVGNEVIPVAVDALRLAGSLEGSFSLSWRQNCLTFELQRGKIQTLMSLCIINTCIRARFEVRGVAHRRCCFGTRRSSTTGGNIEKGKAVGCCSSRGCWMARAHHSWFVFFFFLLGLKAEMG